ncbi:XIAP-associated factor 1 isoform X2 [Heteronotia binoei]|uniref:XIAP-associated factor 1 isoform X2 n=1 Tax=Heteronotia binoei TaxID=13085 RepID=UPI00292F76A0|nr:XIAP-associated factor 1 isoform X2 [Heteronotia binoei]
MKVKEEPRREMEKETRLCNNCKREVAASNFSLHEAHCMRFLAICPKCDELVASKDMKEHFAKAHKESEECPERSIQCQFCELDLPYHKLQIHQETCGSRTTSCWHCSKYIMYKALKEHKAMCQARDRGHSSSENLCQHCQSWFHDEKYLQHLNECNPLPQLLGALTTRSSTEFGSPSPPQRLLTPTSPVLSQAPEPDVRPKKKELSSIGRPSLKPPKSRKPAFVATLASTAPQALDDSLYDTLATCSQCNILLPSPTLQKHERKCQRVNSLQVLRRSPRLVRKEGTMAVGSLHVENGTNDHQLPPRSALQPREAALGPGVSPPPP